jgi:hypothetical protein
MTTVGKILVFVNLVFSLLVGAFAVVDYAARTRWAKAFEELTATNEVLSKSRNLYKDESEKRNKEIQKLNEDLARGAGEKIGMKRGEEPRAAELAIKALGSAQARIKSLEDANRNLREGQNTAKREAAKWETTAVLAQKGVKTREDDFKKMRELLATETEANTKLQGQLNDLLDKKVLAEIERRTAQERAEELSKQVEGLAREITRLRAAGSAAPGAQVRGANPPPEDLEGLVKQTDPASGLVMITLGSDAGLARGQTLEVFRFSPVPKYLGTIRIEKVWHKEAAGQATGRLAAPIQVGDRVASRILGSR